MKSNASETKGGWRVCVLVCTCLLAACQTKYEGASLSRVDDYTSGPYRYQIFGKLDFYGQDPRAKAEQVMNAACPQDSPVLLDARASQISGISSSHTYLFAYFTCKQLIPGVQ